MDKNPPVGHIRFQGAFSVFRARLPLDELFPDAVSGEEIFARQRIRSVEITTAVDKIHMAKVTFLDPELTITDVVTEAWGEINRENPDFEIWVVKIGYFGMPEDNWVSFAGIPQITNLDFPRIGSPVVELTLFSPSIVLKKNRTPDGYHLALGNRPPSIQTALDNIGAHYGLSVSTGSLGQVIKLVDEAFEERFENPRQSINQRFGGNRLAYDTFYRLETSSKSPERPSDYSYLTSLANELSIIYKQLFGDNTTSTDIGPITDEVWTTVATADDAPVVNITGGKINMCLAKDLVADLADITLYSYREGERTLLNFSPRVVQAEGQTGTFAPVDPVDDDINARNFGLASRMSSADTLLPPHGRVKSDPQGAWSMGYASAADPDTQSIRAAAASKGIYLASSLTSEPINQEITLNWVLGHLATNIQGDATVIGTPWLRAGKLVALTGLIRGKETPPGGGEEASGWVPLNRIYQIHECTHLVSESGVYETRMTLRGATTDSSLATLRSYIAEEGEEGLLAQKKLYDRMRSSLTQVATDGASAYEEDEQPGFEP